MAGARSNERVSFGDVLRRYRIAAGLTQEALAERAGLSARGLSDLERGARTRPLLATLDRLARALALSETDRAILESSAKRPVPFESDELSRASRHSGLLPTPTSSFVGRQHELALVRELLVEGRIVTLLGPGGIGKTRLAIEATTGISHRFTNGVVFVELASIRHPDMIAGALTQALGMQEMGDRSVIDRLHGYLRNSDLLLVLDNFEHVLSAADLVASLLASCPRLRVLITSRAPLRIAGEREFVVQPLALPDSRNLPSASLLVNYESVQLFIERGTAIRADLHLSDEQVRVAAEICARLDGLPLAIELAAARLRVLSPNGLLQRLEPRLPLLIGGPRDLPARQQTLTATIAWSYDLLEREEQRLFRALSVFVGGFTLEAAEAVCGHADSGLAVLDGLESLLAKSLIGPGEGDSHSPRFRMLETVREYAIDRARAMLELAELRRRHAVYFLDLGEQAGPEITSARAPEWLRRLEADHDNLRACLSWALEAHDPETALRLSSAIWPFWYAYGYLTEGTRWLEAALRISDTLPRDRSNQVSTRSASQYAIVRARALAGAGILAHYQGDYARAATLCGESLAICREVGDQPGTAIALRGLALVSRSGGDFATARTMYGEARRIYERLGDRWGLSYTLRYLAVVLWMEANHTEARPVIEAALNLAKEIGDGQGAATTLTVRSFVARSLNENEASEVAAREALALHEGYGDRRGRGQALWALGMALSGQGRYGEAGAHHQRALAIFSEVGDRYFTSACLVGLAEVALAAGRPRDAVRLLGAGSAIMSAMGARLWPSIQPHLQRTLDRARDRLGESVFGQAWSDGQSLSVEQAVTLGMAQPAPAQAIPRSARRTSGAPRLTDRELGVADCIARGLTNKEIAAELVIAEGTADRHVANILNKLGFRSRAQIAGWVVEHESALTH